jgi:hypothetical protein
VTTLSHNMLPISKCTHIYIYIYIYISIDIHISRTGEVPQTRASSTARQRIYIYIYIPRDNVTTLSHNMYTCIYGKCFGFRLCGLPGISLASAAIGRGTAEQQERQVHGTRLIRFGRNRLSPRDSAHRLRPQSAEARAEQPEWQVHGACGRS